ncbi:Replication-associated recombination protein RarA [hydrothermal vent metagenome]|uniref:Replication-associated recombination protein RarA n=1 Tax=hydrothermal vent metagenome TaxID=652676 RepID=A0A3B1AEB2_9ZZZZ
MKSDSPVDDLFAIKQRNEFKPLADRLRPATLAEFYGQQHLIAAGKPLQQAIEHNKLHSMILWGPPGTGKTTLAKMIAIHCDAQFITLSAVLSGVKDIRAAMDSAKDHYLMNQKHSILFVDEVHRFNKAQQDAFLPFVEDGTITFIGATTENPSFELNNALLSRARVYVLKSLQADDIKQVLKRALKNKDLGLGGQNIIISDSDLDKLADIVDGDARRGLNLLEIAADLAEEVDGHKAIDDDVLKNVLQHSYRRFDKQGEAFYDQISALHKSVRGSSPDGALYWFVRMLDGGCDPLYIARRVVRMASEDIGNADPRGLQLALNAWDVQQRLGHPEGELAIAQAIIYLSCTPKSNAVYKAYNHAKKDVQASGSAEVPMHLRNAPTKLMDELGYGKHYRYAHDEPHAYAAGEDYFPDGINPTQYYQPLPYGLEQKISERMSFLRNLDEKTKHS